MPHFRAKDCQINLLGYTGYKGISEIEFEMSVDIEPQNVIGLDEPFNEQVGEPQYNGKATFVAEAFFTQIWNKIPKGNNMFGIKPFDITIIYMGLDMEETTVVLRGVIMKKMTSKITTKSVEAIPVDLYVKKVEKL